MRVFVTGANGFVGSYTVAALRAAGHQIVGLVRSPKDSDEAVRYVTGNITKDSAERLASLMAGCDAVIHLVGIIAETPGEGETFERVHAYGTKNVLEAAKHASRSHPIQRFIYMSAIGVSPAAKSEYGRTKAMAEESVRASGFPYTIFRPSILFGPGGEFLRLVEQLVTKPPLSPFPVPFVPIPGDGQTRFQPLYIGDLMHCLVNTLADSATANQSYEIGGSEEVTFDELVYRVAERKKIKKPQLHVPMPAMFAGASVLEKLLPHPPVTGDQLINLGIDNVCDNDRVRQVFDFMPLDFDGVLDKCYG